MYDTDKSEIENEIPDTSGHVKKKKITMLKSLEQMVKYQVLLV